MPLRSFGKKSVALITSSTAAPNDATAAGTAQRASH